MASVRRFSCLRKLLKPFNIICNIKCKTKYSSNDNNTTIHGAERKDDSEKRVHSGFFTKLNVFKKLKRKTSNLESEEKLQPSTNEEELINVSTSFIREEERNEFFIQVKTCDSNACAKEEQHSELSAISLKEEETEKVEMVETDEITEPCSNEKEENNSSTSCIEVEIHEPYTSCKAEEERCDDSTMCQMEEQKDESVFTPCTNEEPSTICLKEKKVARKGKKNKKQKVKPEEKPSTICLNEENGKKIARKERKAKKRLVKAEIEKTTETGFVGLYRPLYACISEKERNQEPTYKMETWKTKPDSAPCINEEYEILPFTDCLHERRDKKEARKGRKYNRQAIKAEEKNKREKIADEYKSRSKFYADEENEFSDDSCEYIGVPGQTFPDGTDAWIPELNLTQEHKMALRGREYLDDRIIDAAQSLLKIQFETEGLQSCLLSQIGFHAVKGPSVQIHYDSVQRHWLTSCFKMDHVEIADSAVTKQHCTSLRKQINECYSELVNDPEATMEILDVDQQADIYDSGVYAIANAFEFLSGGNPICKYDEKKMKRHLIRCFNRRKFTAFPKKLDACVVELEPTLNFTWLDRK
ncbi:hypothetical protein XENTR_v10024088 [Xenopus tropicalis]|nr:hypothetical protein XENTR_v10024088 [Xenopus tropicalis]